MEDTNIASATTLNESADNVAESNDKPKAQVKKKSTYKEKECQVLRFNKKDKTIDIMFDKYGVKLRTNMNNYDAKTITVKYKGTIGTKDFEIKL